MAHFIKKKISLISLIYLFRGLSDYLFFSDRKPMLHDLRVVAFLPRAEKCFKG